MTTAQRVTFLLGSFLSIAAPAAAQQPSDTAFLQKAIAAVQAQRNEAMDRVAGAEARLAVMADDLAKTQGEVARLKAKLEPPKPIEEPKKE